MSMDTTENILETIRMIEEQNLDIRTVTMGTVSYTHLTLPTICSV